MEKEKKQRLESMLRAVQDLKSNYYIGTELAFCAIRAVSEIYSNPERIASMLNERAKYSLDSVLVTPERLNGIGLLLKSLEEGFIEEFYLIRENSDPDFDRVCSMLFNNPSTNLAQNLIMSNGHRFSFLGYQQWIFGCPKKFVVGYDAKREEEYRDKLFRYSQELFSEINRIGMKTSKELGEFLSLKLYEELENISLPEIDESAIQNFSLAVYQVAQGLNWEYLFSSDAFNKSRRESKKMVEESYIQWELLVESLMKDRVDHRVEYRRQVLVSYLLSIESEITTYDEVVKYVKDQELKHKSIFYAVKDFINDMIRTSEFFTPLDAMNKTNRVSELSIIKNLQFVRNLIGSEKNWLVKFLRS